MSRIPAPSSRSRSPMKPASTATPTKTRLTAPSSVSSPIRTRTQSAVSRTPVKPKPVAKLAAKPPPPPPEEDAPTPQLSMKEQIALKRAEAQKAKLVVPKQADDDIELASPFPEPEAEEDILNRLSVRESIEKARSTGSLNLVARSLPCLPSALFDIHLGVTPAPLKSVPKEPDLPPSKGSKSTAWFEAQDLQVLKAWNNEILELQPEISMFGSLKTLDLHANKLTVLPDSLADLTALMILDLSHNSLTSLPTNLFALPELTVLNISHNFITSLPFSAPFEFEGGRPLNDKPVGGSFFAPSVNRATTPLPVLSILDASYNKLTAASIDLQLPTILTKVDLSENPLADDGDCEALLRKLADMRRLKELRLEKAHIKDSTIRPETFPSNAFPALTLLHLGETRITYPVAELAFQRLTREVTYEVTNHEPPEGVLQIIIGKPVLRESWEVAAANRSNARTQPSEGGINWGEPKKAPVVKKAVTPATNVQKEDWELEVGLSEGAKRRLRAQAATKAAEEAAAAKSATAKATTRVSASTSANTSQPLEKKEVVKEDWEIEAEQGLLTEGGRRRARARAAAEAAASRDPSPSKPSSISVSLANPQYYDPQSRTLTLPRSTTVTKAPGHLRHFSAAITPSNFDAFQKGIDLAVPTPSLPLVEIAAQPFASTLKELLVANRKMDKCITVPEVINPDVPLLPNLEHLCLEECNLGDSVSVARVAAGNGAAPTRTMEPLLPLLTSLFPTLQNLDVSYNGLSGSALTKEVLAALILSTSQRKGLRQLNLRGNKIMELEGFRELGDMFRGNREVTGWHLDELDIRDNEIGKLPPELGLLPLDVFLVDGNTFRVPARRIWEREGTKGLLSWLRGRIE